MSDLFTFLKNIRLKLKTYSDTGSIEHGKESIEAIVSKPWLSVGQFVSESLKIGQA